MSILVKQTNNPIEKEWINWLNEAIKNDHIKYYEYEQFDKIKLIGSGAFSDVYRAKWKHTEKVFALKAFKNKGQQNIAFKEIINEVFIYLLNIILCTCIYFYAFIVVFFFLRK